MEAAAGTTLDERGDGDEEEEEEDDDGDREVEEESVDDSEVVEDDEDETEAFELFRRRLRLLARCELRRFSFFALRCFGRPSALPSCCCELSSACSSAVRLPSLSALLAVLGAWKAEEAVRRRLPIDEPTGVMGSNGDTSKEEEAADGEEDDEEEEVEEEAAAVG